MFRLPLYGIRVVDLTTGWAGPYAARLLADMGAEVIKVEAARSCDPLRSHRDQPHPEDRPWNMSSHFNRLNRNKYGLSLDISHPDGRQLLLRLVALSSVVVEGFPAEVRARLGLTLEALQQASRDIILVSVAGRDEEGIGDPVAGIAAAGAVALALWQRRRTGRGQHIQVGEEEALLSFAGGRILAHSSQRPRRGEPPPSMAPHGCYPCRGDNRWVALACEDDRQFAALCEALGRPDLAQDPRFTDVVSRRRHRVELDSIIAAWTGERTREEAAAALQAAGVAAAPVFSPSEVLADPHLRARGFFEPVAHPEAGVSDMDGTPWRFSESPGHVRLPAPCFAEHNDYVLRHLLGLTDQEIEALARKDVIADRPDWPARQ